MSKKIQVSNPTEVVTFRLTKPDVRYLEERAEQLGVKRAQLIQQMVIGWIKEQQRLPASELAVDVVEPLEDPGHVPLPENTGFWKKWKEGMGG